MRPRAPALFSKLPGDDDFALTMKHGDNPWGEAQVDGHPPPPSYGEVTRRFTLIGTAQDEVEPGERDTGRWCRKLSRSRTRRDVSGAGSWGRAPPRGGR